jgi:predicted nucleic acid-binding protein
VAPPLIVLDTNVVVASILGREDSDSSLLLQLIYGGNVRPALSDAYLIELFSTVRKPDIERRGSVGRAFEAGLSIGFHGKHHHPRRYDWPSIPDRKDWWILDLAFESGADHIVTWNMDHLSPARSLGFDVLTPPELLARLLPPVE